MEAATGRAWPRVGLLGNPSDGYGGRVLAFTFEDFRAEVGMRPATGLTLRAPGSPPVEAAGWTELRARGRIRDIPGAASLLLAALEVLVEHGRTVDDLPPSVAEEVRDPRIALEAQSDIPRQVGLAGSSAIIMAALRALRDGLAMQIGPLEMARLALRAETEILGIVAGPQDRLIQAHEGLMDMDFAGAWTYEPVDADLLPPLYLAWDPQPGESSGGVHDDVRQRWERGDPEVVAAMKVFAELARVGATCLQRGDVAGLKRAVDGNFDQRAAIWRLGQADREMVELGRAHGAAVKLCGSGGAVVGVMGPDEDAGAIEAAYRESGYPWLRPAITRPPRRSTRS